LNVEIIDRKIDFIGCKRFSLLLSVKQNHLRLCIYIRKFTGIIDLKELLCAAWQEEILLLNICGTRRIGNLDRYKPLIAVLMMHVWYNASTNIFFNYCVTWMLS
jgi:hypothetical protein